MTHNPHVDITKETTTLYASDRDVFLFLVDDTHPIEAGRLPNGDPDLFFRGFTHGIPKSVAKASVLPLSTCAVCARTG